MSNIDLIAVLSFADVYAHYHSTATYEKNNVLGTVCLSVRDGVPSLVSTDGSRLHWRDYSEPRHVPEVQRADYLIPGRFLRDTYLAMKKAKVKPRNALVSVYADRTTIDTEKDSFHSRHQDGTYPQWRKLIPSVFNTTVTLPGQPLWEALKRAKPITNDRTRIVRLAIEPGKLTVLVKNVGVKENFTATYDESLNADVKGDGLSVAFNINYLSEAVEGVMDRYKAVKLEFNPGLSPAVVSGQDADMKCLIMPVQVKD